MGEFVLMPSARHLAQSKGLDATVLAPGSGKGGRVTKGDVLQGIAQNKLPALPVAATAAPAAVAAAPVAAAVAPLALADLVAETIVTDGPTEDVTNSKMRQIIASRLTESKQTVPHFYTSFQVELDAVLALRKTLASEHEVKVSVNDFVIRCAALALRDVPEVNGGLVAGGNAVKYSDSIDISIAVATPTGLITPIVFDTDAKGLSEISSAVKDLATRARDGKLAPHEYQGGTFSISNLGMFGISEFSAVINPPQAAILAVGGGTPTFKPTPYVEGAEEQASPSKVTLMTARLSADRRVVDEPTASLFGQAFTYYMNQPQLLLL
uniref:Peripheral subunit-binding (PSBD) domain-containing protein n=1 Tax=Entomoneis paludosa TaxID=265537 RepID=A0A6U2Z6N1_9STRA